MAEAKSLPNNLSIPQTIVNPINLAVLRLKHYNENTCYTLLIYVRVLVQNEVQNSYQTNGGAILFVNPQTLS